MEEQCIKYQQELKNFAPSHSAKELRALKCVVRNFEQDLMREKTNHQRSSSKRGRQYRELLEEVCTLICGDAFLVMNKNGIFFKNDFHIHEY